MTLRSDYPLLESVLCQLTDAMFGLADVILIMLLIVHSLTTRYRMHLAVGHEWANE